MQHQIMLKQMQEMQHHQQFQSLNDTRQNSSSFKNVDGNQFSPVINGTPVHSKSNMFTNWGQHSGSPSAPGMSQFGDDGVQQYDGTSYDSPMPCAGSNFNQIYFQGISSGSPQQQQPVIHSLGFTQSIPGGQNLESLNQAFTSRQDYLRSNVYGQVHQNLSENNTYGNFEHASVLPKNAMVYEINENKQGWTSYQLDTKSMHISPSPGSATLDPLEEKIMFSMDDNLWDTSGKSIELGTGNPGNALGSWSALMQSALAETSSSETGMQEEWSSLTFQNTDPSADNQTSNFVESGHQQAECVVNGMLPSSNLNAAEYQYLNSPGMNFPGFHQAVTMNQSEQDRSLQASFKQNQLFSQTGGRFEINQQQLSQTVVRPQPQIMSQAKHGWSSPNPGHVESNPSQFHLASANQQITNTDFWSEQKSYAGTLAQHNDMVNNFLTGRDSQTSLVTAGIQNQENNQLAHAYHTNTADPMRDGVRMVSQRIPNNTPQVFGGSSMLANLNATQPSVQGRPEDKLPNTIDNSMIYHASDMCSQRSQNALRLLQNMNLSRVEGTLAHGNIITQGQKTTAASEAQHHNHSTSQGSSSQKFQNHNIMHASQNSWQQTGTPIPLSSVPNQSQLHWQHTSRPSGISQSIQNTLYSAAIRSANAAASPRQNSPGSKHASPFARQYSGTGSLAASQLPVAPNFSQRDMFPSKPINQWTDVPTQKHAGGLKSELVKGSGMSDKHAEEMIGYLQNLNEQDTKVATPSRSSAKPVMKYEEKKSHLQILSAMHESGSQPTPEIQEPVGNLSSEKNSSMNQMNILYGNQEDTVMSTKAVVNQCLAITRPNKRKSQTFELLPWHKEVEKVSITFPDTRMGEHYWAQASNLLMEVANEAELRNFGRAIIRPRKRLSLTTRLLQTVLCPAPRTILAKDAASTYDSVSYIVARLSLGDACNMSSACVKTKISNKCNTEEKSNLSKVLENFGNRFKRLEDALQRSDEMPAVVDISVEYQDLERFSVINRFAKFHSRPQPNPSEPFSSGPPKMYPQRYVSAFPMPKEIPDGLQCISL